MALVFQIVFFKYWFMYSLKSGVSLQKVMFPATYNHTRKLTSHAFIKDKLTKRKSKITILQQILNSFLVSATPNVCYTG